MASTPSPVPAGVLSAGHGPTAVSALAGALGGVRGVVEAGLPGVAFALIFSLTRVVSTAVTAAVVLGVLLAVARLVRRDTLRHAGVGLVGVVVAALVALRTGSAQAYYLPGLLLNGGYAAAYALSALLGWPLLGLVLGPLLGEGVRWRQDPVRRRAYTAATWVWAGVYALRLAVGVPLYLSGAVLWLGVSRVALGVPVFVLGAWLTYGLLRRLPSTGTPPA